MRFIKSKELEKHIGERVFVGDRKGNIEDFIDEKDSDAKFGILGKDNLGFFVDVCDFNSLRYPLIGINKKEEMVRLGDRGVVGLEYSNGQIICYNYKFDLE